MLYRSREIQERLIQVFHSALNRHGLFYPGGEDTVGRFSDLFRLLNDRFRIYQVI